MVVKAIPPLLLLLVAQAGSLPPPVDGTINLDAGLYESVGTQIVLAAGQSIRIVGQGPEKTIVRLANRVSPSQTLVAGGPAFGNVEVEGLTLENAFSGLTANVAYTRNVGRIVFRNLRLNQVRYPILSSGVGTAGLSTNYVSAGITIEDCFFNFPNPEAEALAISICQGWDNLTIRNVVINGYSDGIRLGHNANSYGSGTLRYLFRNSVIENITVTNQGSSVARLNTRGLHICAPGVHVRNAFLARPIKNPKMPVSYFTAAFLYSESAVFENIRIVDWDTTPHGDSADGVLWLKGNDLEKLNGDTFAVGGNTTLRNIWIYNELCTNLNWGSISMTARHCTLDGALFRGVAGTTIGGKQSLVNVKHGDATIRNVRAVQTSAKLVVSANGRGNLLVDGVTVSDSRVPVTGVHVGHVEDASVTNVTIRNVRLGTVTGPWSFMPVELGPINWENTMHNVLVENCSGYNRAAGVMVQNAHVFNGRFAQNTLHNPEPIRGGVVYLASGSLNNSIVSGNAAIGSGGFYAAADVGMTNVIVTGNLP